MEKASELPTVCLQFNPKQSYTLLGHYGIVQGSPTFFEPVGTFGNLSQSGECYNGKMSASGGGASHKMSGSEVMYNSDCNSSAFQV